METQLDLSWYKGLPWWLSGKESTCKRQRHGFDSQIRRITLEKEMTTHSSTLAWEIPRTEKPGRLPSMGLHSWTRLCDQTTRTNRQHSHSCRKPHSITAYFKNDRETIWLSYFTSIWKTNLKNNKTLICKDIRIPMFISVSTDNSQEGRYGAHAHTHAHTHTHTHTHTRLPYEILLSYQKD